MNCFEWLLLSCRKSFPTSIRQLIFSLKLLNIVLSNIDFLKLEIIFCIILSYFYKHDTNMLPILFSHIYASLKNFRRSSYKSRSRSFTTVFILSLIISFSSERFANASLIVESTSSVVCFFKSDMKW